MRTSPFRKRSFKDKDIESIGGGEFRRSAGCVQGWHHKRYPSRYERTVGFDFRVKEAIRSERHPEVPMSATPQMGLLGSSYLGGGAAGWSVVHSSRSIHRSRFPCLCKQSLGNLLDRLNSNSVVLRGVAKRLRPVHFVFMDYEGAESLEFGAGNT
jgi:hypothetical protein